MSSNAVSVCSNALLLLGAKPINSLTEESDRAALAANLWPQVRDRLLRSHPWNCAVKRRVLAPEASSPEFDFAYRFPLPEDWLRTLQVGDEVEPIDFRHEGRALLANVNALPIKYIFANEDVGSWDPGLVHVATLAMAAAMAYPITQSASLRDSMQQELAAELKRARAVDGQDEPPGEIVSAPLLEARFAGTVSRFR